MRAPTVHIRESLDRSLLQIGWDTRMSSLVNDLNIMKSSSEAVLVLAAVRTERVERARSTAQHDLANVKYETRADLARSRGNRYVVDRHATDRNQRKVRAAALNSASLPSRFSV